MVAMIPMTTFLVVIIRIGHARLRPIMIPWIADSANTYNDNK